MTVSIAKRHRSIFILLGLMILSLAGLLLVRAIPQDQSYHDFADQRALFGMPNFWNVISNLLFVPIGAVGLWQFRRDPATIVLFLGIFLTGFGSAYYHWNPNDHTLLWDRVPIALSFMAILVIVIEERVDERAGVILLWPLLALAVLSLLLWRWTDDLRLYAWVQFFPFVAMLVLFLSCPPRYTGTYYWIVAAVIYAIAKVFEQFDGAIYSIGYVVSGHTLKHLAAAAACLVILRHLQVRRPIA
jgi:hypothetical protein